MSVYPPHPRFKLTLKTLLQQFLYLPVQTKQRMWCNSLIARNTVIQGGTHQSFMYQGELYYNDKPPFPRILARLSPKLYPEMKLYLQEVKEVEEEQVFTIGYVTKVLNVSNNPFDYLRMLPECVHAAIKKEIAAWAHLRDYVDETEIQAIMDNNAHAVGLIKQRMALNLLN